MIYGISILAAAMAIILWPKAARRIFWAWFLFFFCLRPAWAFSTSSARKTR